MIVLTVPEVNQVIQKSNTYSEDDRRSALEVIDFNLRKHCDYICGIGCGALVFTLIGIVYLLIILL